MSMYSTNDLQKLVLMLSYLGIVGPGSYPAHSVVLGAGAHADPGAAGAILASNGASADPSFQSLAALGIQTALGYTPAHAGANADITSITGLSTALAINQGGTGSTTAATARTALGAAGRGANTDITSLSAPALGAATATTAAPGARNTQVATTAFVVGHSPVPSILDYGGDATGTNDNSTAFAAALAAGIGGHPAIYFPPGIYKFSGNIAYTLPNSTASVSIFGAGADVTQLFWPAGGGMTLTEISQFNSIHVRDLSFLTGTTATGTALNIVQSQATVTNPALTAPSDITNVVIRGFDGYQQTDYWATGIVINGASNFNFINDTIVSDSSNVHGDGVNVFGASLVIPVVFNFIGCNFLGLNQGVIYGNYAQGFTFSQCNFTAGAQGIIAPNGLTGLDQLVVANCQFGYLTGNGVVTASGVPNTQIVGCLFIEPNSANGINLQIAGLFSIIGNTFAAVSGSPSGNSAISVGTTVNSWPGVISGNVFKDQAAFSIQLQAGSNHVNVQSNVYVTSPAPSNAGTSNTIGGGSA
jgi:hypothetical protein